MKNIWYIGITLFIFIGYPCFSYGKEHKIVFNSQDTRIWKEKLDVDLNFDIKKGGIDIELDTTAQPEGYYSTYIFTPLKVELDLYDVLALEIENKSDQPIRFNINFEKKDINATLDNGQEVLLEVDSGNKYEAIKVDQGLVEVPKGYSGIMLITLEKLKPSIKNTEKIGITMTMEEGRKGKLYIKQGVLKKLDQELLYLLDLEIVGDREVQKPVYGESISQYHIAPVGKGLEKFKLRIDEGLRGVTLSAEDTLVITPEVDADEITLYTGIVGQFEKVLRVNIVGAWTAQLPEEEKKQLTIPQPDELPGIVAESPLLVSEAVLMGLRIVVVMACVGVLSLYWLWNKQDDRE